MENFNFNFNVGEIVWAKIRGYPWWPACITGIEEDNKEKKYCVGFIGDNTHATLPKKCMAKFQKEYKTHSITKKRSLLESIKIAREMSEKKIKEDDDIDFQNPNMSWDKESNKDKNKITSEKNDSDENEFESDHEETERLVGKKSNQKVGHSKNPQELSNNNSLLNRKKRRVVEEKRENNEVNDLMRKIINYLIFICKNIEKNEIKTIENGKPCLMKVLDFLKDHKMSDPIEFLKKTYIGKMIKYINSQTEDSEIKESTSKVYKNFEEQVLDQLFKKAK